MQLMNLRLLRKDELFYGNIVWHKALKNWGPRVRFIRVYLCKVICVHVDIYFCLLTEDSKAGKNKTKSFKLTFGLFMQSAPCLLFLFCFVLFCFIYLVLFLYNSYLNSIFYLFFFYAVSDRVEAGCRQTDSLKQWWLIAPITVSVVNTEEHKPLLGKGWFVGSDEKNEIDR